MFLWNFIIHDIVQVVLVKREEKKAFSLNYLPLAFYTFIMHHIQATVESCTQPRHGNSSLNPELLTARKKSEATTMKLKLVWGIFVVPCRHMKFQRDHRGFSKLLENISLMCLFAFLSVCIKAWLSRIWMLSCLWHFLIKFDDWSLAQFNSEFTNEKSLRQKTQQNCGLKFISWSINWLSWRVFQSC